MFNLLLHVRVRPLWHATQCHFARTVPTPTGNTAAAAMFATAAAATVATTAAATSLFYFDSSTLSLQPSSPYVYEELDQGREQRKGAERALQQYLAQIRLDFHRIRVQSRSEEEFALEMGRLKEKVLSEQQRITFGVEDPHAREKYLSQYGCCKWTPRAVQLIKDLHCPLLEIGAGAGHWQKELTNNGIDVVAYDDRSNVSLPGRGGAVHVGGIEQIHIHSERALFLCYPPEGTMALDCLAAYMEGEGEYFIYVGEGRQGVNGSNEFFDMLESDWNIVAMDKLDPFPQCFERLWVLQRNT